MLAWENVCYDKNKAYLFFNWSQKILEAIHGGLIQLEPMEGGSNPSPNKPMGVFTPPTPKEDFCDIAIAIFDF